MMSQKDFTAIARIIRGDVATATPAQFQKLFVVTLSLADYFQQANPRFDRSKFYDACFGDVSWKVSNDSAPELDSSVTRHPDFKVTETAGTYGLGDDPSPDDETPLFEGVRPEWIYGQTGD
jgi:hypothetical protein